MTKFGIVSEMGNSHVLRKRGDGYIYIPSFRKARGRLFGGAAEALLTPKRSSCQKPSPNK